MTTTVTVKGQVTLPKAVRDAAGIKPGDRVEVRNVPGVGVVIERERDDAQAAFRRQLEDIARRQPMRGGPFKDMTSDEIMRLLRGEE
jgi:antitoxin PrlF